VVVIEHTLGYQQRNTRGHLQSTQQRRNAPDRIAGEAGCDQNWWIRNSASTTAFTNDLPALIGPAHAIAISCSDRGFHHGMLSGIGSVNTLDATAERCP
jgi:hypothetical protein